MVYLRNNLALITTLLAVVSGYLLSYGSVTLYPANTDWLMSAYHDWGTHYLGFRYFLSEPWQWPIGHIANYNYPAGTNVGFTDSIPLIAIPLKLIFGSVKGPFQFFGWWLLSCHVLTAFFTFQIFRLYKVRGAIAVVGAILVGLNPVIFYRGMHPALCAHWVVLASFYYYILPINSQNVHRVNGKQIILLVLSGLINPYLFLFVLGFNLILPLKHVLIDLVLDWKKALFYFMSGGALTVFVWWMVGLVAFDNKVGMEVSSSYGLYGTNLNSLFNSSGFSMLLPALDLYTDHQYEGFAYLGLGMMLLIGMCILFLGKAIIYNGYKIGVSKRMIPFLCLLALVTLFSVTHIVSFNQQILVSFPIPDFIQSVGNIFRASGRYIWLFYYSIFVGTFIFFYQVNLNRSVKVVLLLAICVVQFYDIQLFFKNKNFTEGEFSPKEFQDVKWLSLFNQFERVISYPPYSKINNRLEYQDIGYLAVQSSMPITMGYAARETTHSNIQFASQYNSLIDSNKIPEGDLILTNFNHLNTFMSFLISGTLKIGVLDDYCLLYSSNNNLTDIYFDFEKTTALRDSLQSILKQKYGMYKVDASLIENCVLKKNVEKLTIGKSTLRISGWAFPLDASNNAGNTVKILLKGTNNSYLIDVEEVNRKDVTKYFLKEYLDNSGFQVFFPTKLLPPDKYEVFLSIKYSNGLLCAESLGKTIIP